MKPLQQLKQDNIAFENKNLQRINIFITKDQYKKLLDLKYKYRLSFGYIVRIIGQHYSCVAQLNDKCNLEQYYNTRTMRKTSIKIPKIDENSHNARYYNNAVIMFIEKYEKNYITEKQNQKLRNLIYNEFENTLDPLWEWDKYARYQYRFDKIKERI